MNPYPRRVVVVSDYNAKAKPGTPWMTTTAIVLVTAARKKTPGPT